MRAAFLLALIMAAPAPALADELRVGAASVDITPPVGTPMAGYYAERLSKGVHDPLFAKAIVLERGGKKAALVALDLISTPIGAGRGGTPGDREDLRHQRGRRDDLRHPRPYRPGAPGRRGAGVRLRRRQPLAVAYGEGLPAKIAEGVRLAEQALRPAKVAVGHGQESAISFNRRFHMTDGTVGWNPGKLNPKILKPAGTIDPDVAVVYFEADDKAGTPLATYVNHAVHLDNVGGMEFSADMPATIAELLGRFKGPGMVTLYTSGCCGDINHIDVRWAEAQWGHDNAARMGVILAAEVLKTWPRLKVEPPGALRVKSARVKLPLAKITPEDVETARAVVARLRREGQAARVPGAGPGLQGPRRGGPPGRADRGRGPGRRPGRPDRLGLAARRDLRRAGPGDQAGLAVPPHHHRRAGQRRDRLHPLAAGLRPGELRGRRAPDAPRGRARCWWMRP